LHRTPWHEDCLDALLLVLICLLLFLLAQRPNLPDEAFEFGVVVLNGGQDGLNELRLLRKLELLVKSKELEDLPGQLKMLGAVDQEAEERLGAVLEGKI